MTVEVLSPKITVNQAGTKFIGSFVGNEGGGKRIKAAYIGDENGVARKISQGCIGVDNKARAFARYFSNPSVDYDYLDGYPILNMSFDRMANIGKDFIVGYNNSGNNVYTRYVNLNTMTAFDGNTVTVSSTQYSNAFVSRVGVVAEFESNSYLIGGGHKDLSAVKVTKNGTSTAYEKILSIKNVSNLESINRLDHCSVTDNLTILMYFLDGPSNSLIYRTYYSTVNKYGTFTSLVNPGGQYTYGLPCGNVGNKYAFIGSNYNNMSFLSASLTFTQFKPSSAWSSFLMPIGKYLLFLRGRSDYGVKVDTDLTVTDLMYRVPGGAPNTVNIGYYNGCPDNYLHMLYDYSASILSYTDRGGEISGWTNCLLLSVNDALTFSEEGITISNTYTNDQYGVCTRCISLPIRKQIFFSEVSLYNATKPLKDVYVGEK